MMILKIDNTSPVFSSNSISHGDLYQDPFIAYNVESGPIGMFGTDQGSYGDGGNSWSNFRDGGNCVVPSSICIVTWPAPKGDKKQEFYPCECDKPLIPLYPNDEDESDDYNKLIFQKRLKK